MKKLITIATLALVSLPVYAVSLSTFGNTLVEAAGSGNGFDHGFVMGTVTGIVMTDDKICTDKTMRVVADAYGRVILAEIVADPSSDVDVDSQRFSQITQGVLEKMYPCK